MFLETKYSLAVCIGAAEIDQWHLDRGWSGIGYHYVIKRSGTIQHGRHIEKAGAHARGHNAHSVAVCLVGGVDEDNVPENNFSEAQFLSLEGICVYLLDEYLDIMDIRGHRDFEGVTKACPSFDVKEDFLDKNWFIREEYEKRLRSITRQ